VTVCAKLFSPLKIGKHILNNRIIFGPHRTNFAVQNLPSKQHVNYYERRAKGGVGLTIIEGGCIHPSDYPYERAIFAYRKAVTDGYGQIAEALHRHGCLAVAQLNHSGGQADSSLSRRETWAPSAVPEINSGEVPKIMEKEDIKEVIEGFVNAAWRLKNSGLDGIEINAGQFSLLRQFLSPLTNYRSDDYGGSLENRVRFCREVLQEVRRATGSDFLIGLRLCGDEYAPWGGLNSEDCRDIARHLCKGGLVDWFTVETGSIYSLHMTAASMRHPEDYAAQPACLIAEAVDIPVCATGSIVSVKLAEKLLNEGVQLAEMTRALIADPDLPAKAKEDEANIRPCILCNQDCYVNSVMNPVLSCAVNPFAGEELKETYTVSPAGFKKVLVAGAGPAGLEAAITAARRGHRVVLYERDSEPGGRLKLAARIPGCGKFQSIIDYLYRCVREIGIEIHLGSNADDSVIAAESPDAVVVATGSRPSPVPFAVDAGITFIRPEELLAGNRKVGSRVMIIDLEGAWQAPGVALSLAGEVEKISIITPEMFVSPELAKNGEFLYWYQQAFQKNIEFIPQTEVIRVSGSCLETVDRFSREKRMFNQIDTIVPVIPAYPDQSLYLRLLKTGIQVWVAGDCVAPRNLGAAIREGRNIGLMI
jgi:mycofactocin system FadH/OYE family oxidoreductase 2